MYLSVFLVSLTLSSRSINVKSPTPLRLSTVRTVAALLASSAPLLQTARTLSPSVLTVKRSSVLRVLSRGMKVGRSAMLSARLLTVLADRLHLRPVSGQ